MWSPGTIEARKRHQVGWNGFVARGYGNNPIPRDDPAVDFQEITQHFPRRKNVIHPVVEHGPAVADVCPMEVGRFPSFLENADGGLFCQLIKMETSRMARSEHIFDKNLGFLKILFVPACSATKGIDLDPIISHFSTFLLSHASTSPASPLSLPIEHRSLLSDCFSDSQ